MCHCEQNTRQKRQKKVWLCLTVSREFSDSVESMTEQLCLRQERPCSEGPSYHSTPEHRKWSQNREFSLTFKGPQLLPAKHHYSLPRHKCSQHEPMGKAHIQTIPMAQSTARIRSRVDITSMCIWSYNGVVQTAEVAYLGR